jgi:hypothetical protein
VSVSRSRAQQKKQDCPRKSRVRVGRRPPFCPLGRQVSRPVATNCGVLPCCIIHNPPHNRPMPHHLDHCPSRWLLGLARSRPGPGTGAGSLTPKRKLHAFLAYVLLRGHMNPWFAAEGFLSSVSATASVQLGVLAGSILHTSKNLRQKTIKVHVSWVQGTRTHDI